MILLMVAAVIALLVLLITVVRLHPFLAFLVVAILGGWWLGIPLEKIPSVIQRGMGDLLGSLVIVITVGAMLGKLVADSGAAQKIATVLMRITGPRYLGWALMLTGFVVGIPLFYNVGFVLLVPLVFSIVFRYKLPAVATGIPLLAALSVTHGFLPPHPAPAALVAQFGAHMGKTLLYGMVVAIPAIVLAGPVFARFLRGIPAQPLATFQPRDLPEAELPGARASFGTALLPVLLLALTTVLSARVPQDHALAPLIAFLSEPSVVLLISLAVALWVLGLARGRSIRELMEPCAEAIRDVAPILLVVAGAGALKQVFTDSGVNDAIGQMLSGLPMHPLVTAWLVAAVIRVCIGSATVAGLTAAGMVAPALAHTGVDPQLMVLSIGAGSLMFSHVNDAGFWMFKEYFNVSVGDTIRSWSVMETIVAVAGLLGVLALQALAG